MTDASAATPAPASSTPTPPQPTPTPTPDKHRGRDHDRHHDNDGNVQIEIVGIPGIGFIPGGVPIIPQQLQPPVVQQPVAPAAPAVPANPPADPVAVAQGRLDRVTAELQRQFEESADYRAALAELKGATAAYNQTLITERQGIKSDPEYQAALADKERATKAVAAAWRSNTEGASATQPTKVTADQLNAAQAKLAAAKKVADMENRSLDNDPNVIAARQRVAAAKSHLDKLRADHVADLASNPVWQTAQQQLDSAKLTAALGQ